jgi:hypothetical protein
MPAYELSYCSVVVVGGGGGGGGGVCGVCVCKIHVVVIVFVYWTVLRHCLSVYQHVFSYSYLFLIPGLLRKLFILIWVLGCFLLLPNPSMQGQDSA